MTVVEVLKRARAILVKRGWCQYRYEQAGAFCSLGALRMATNGNVWQTDKREYVRARQRLLKAIGAEYVDVWNDEEKRTKRQVLAAFTRAIHLAEKRGRK